MAALWAFVPSDGIAVITTWFYQKVIDVRVQIIQTKQYLIDHVVNLHSFIYFSLSTCAKCSNFL